MLTHSPDQEIRYRPGGPTIKRFHESKAFVRGVRGPIGSSKSTACVMEILARAQLQAPREDGIRYTRWAIIRNSYPELKSTTMKTWAEWCPSHYGKVNHDSPITHHVKTAGLDMEVLFLALDREEDVRKLLSLELTGAWINEAREIPKGILDALTGRVGRYPAKRFGGATWSGILMDTNPPDDQSWWFRCAEEEEVPKGWEFLSQPSGVSPEAENIENLPDQYYERLMAGKDEDWINVYVHGNYGYVAEGKPVFPMYRDRLHCAASPISPIPELALEIGGDFGLTPAAIIGQRMANGRWLVLDELTTEDCGIQRFAELLGRYVRQNYPDHEVAIGWGDPAGNARGPNDEKTALEIMREYTGWTWKAAPTNEILMRLEVVRVALNRLVDGDPGFLISPKCKMLRKGFISGYHFKSVRTGNGTQYHETPAKNEYSHPMDGLQALLLGGGEHEVILNKMRTRDRKKTRSTKVADGIDYPVFGESEK